MSRARHPSAVIVADILTSHGFPDRGVSYIDPGRDGGIVRLKVQHAPDIYDLPDVKLEAINNDLKVAFGDRYVSSDRWRTQRGVIYKGDRPKAFVVHIKG